MENKDFCRKCGGKCCKDSKLIITLKEDEVERMRKLGCDIHIENVRERIFGERKVYHFHEPCPIITSSGCPLNHEDRPTVCRKYLCIELKENLSSEKQSP